MKLSIDPYFPIYVTNRFNEVGTTVGETTTGAVSVCSPPSLLLNSWEVLPLLLQSALVSHRHLDST